MKLTFEQIQNITQGAERILECNGLIHFFRFSDEEEQLYAKMHPQFINKTFNTAGISMEFETDGDVLEIETEVIKDIKTSTYFSFDIFVNGSRHGSIQNFPSDIEIEGYDLKNFPLGEFHGRFDIGVGSKNIKIVFPWSVTARLKSLSLHNATFIKPIKKEKRLLSYGDSITHGHHSMYSSNTYTARLAQTLNVELMNKGIGAEIFFPELAEIKSDFNPDIVTVAYGTNDWVSVDKDTFEINCKRFFTAIKNNYPSAKVFAITPIWRADLATKDGFTEFASVGNIIKNICNDIGDINVINGLDLVPHEKKYYGDLRIHPNDEGFKHYSTNLINKLKLQSY